jgi:hypothetical protein
MTEDRCQRTDAEGGRVRKWEGARLRRAEGKKSRRSESGKLGKKLIADSS